jgi:PKD repeat protein
MGWRESGFAPNSFNREEIMKAVLRSVLNKHLKALVLLLAAAFTMSSCRNDQVAVPPLTGPSGHRLFITMQANPDHLVIHEPNRPRESSVITLQLKNQLGQGVAGENIKLRIVNVTGGEINIGTLDKFNVVTDSAGFATARYTAPNSGEQPIAILVNILAILTNPAYPFEITDQHAIDLERSSINPQPGPPGCVFDGNGPQASFTVTPANPSLNDQVCFDAQASTDTTGQIVAFQWNFGDGSNASGAVVCHEFTEAGTFSVSLTVVDENHNCDQATQSVTVDRGEPATCTIVVSPTPILPDQTVNFTAVVSDPDGRVRRFDWNFGDGSTGRSSRNTITHRYSNPGTFNVVLTITDDQGNVSTCQTTVSVGSIPPICSFTTNPSPPTGNDPFTVSFTSTSTDDTGIVSFTWDFGDGASSSGATVSHTFAAGCTAPCSATFSTTLTVVDEQGNSASCSTTVTVNNP